MIIKSREWHRESSKFVDSLLLEVKTFVAFQVVNLYETQEMLGLATTSEGLNHLINVHSPIEVCPDHEETR